MAGVCPLDAYVLMVLDNRLWCFGLMVQLPTRGHLPPYSPGLRVLGGDVPARSPDTRCPDHQMASPTYHLEKYYQKGWVSSQKGCSLSLSLSSAVTLNYWYGKQIRVHVGFFFLQLCWLLRDKRMPLYYVLLQCLNVTWLSSHHLSSLGLKP